MWTSQEQNSHKNRAPYPNKERFKEHFNERFKERFAQPHVFGRPKSRPRVKLIARRWAIDSNIIVWPPRLLIFNFSPEVATSPQAALPVHFFTPHNSGKEHIHRIIASKLVDRKPHLRESCVLSSVDSKSDVATCHASRASTGHLLDRK